MASLSWNKINPDIKCTDTTKKFFNKYLYKIDVYAPACRIVIEKNTNKSCQERLLTRIEDANERFNRLQPWARNNGLNLPGLRQVIDDGSAEQLEYYKTVLDTHKDTVKFRVEEPTLSVYCNDEQLLYDIASNDPCGRVRKIFRPGNIKAQTLLEEGLIILKKPTPYSYMIYLREGFVKDTALMIRAFEYLESLGDDVKLTASCTKNLTKRYLYVSSSYFYTKNLDCLTFLNLMAPDLVSRIFKIAYLDS